jgi:hypothetical protein
VRYLLILCLVSLSCKEDPIVEQDHIVKIGKCDSFNWCKVESELGKKGIAYKPNLGQKVCSILKSASKEMQDQLELCE